jgi:hypothetical protein
MRGRARGGVRGCVPVGKGDADAPRPCLAAVQDAAATTRSHGEAGHRNRGKPGRRLAPTRGIAPQAKDAEAGGRVDLARSRTERDVGDRLVPDGVADVG